MAFMRMQKKMNVLLCGALYCKVKTYNMKTEKTTTMSFGNIGKENLPFNGKKPLAESAGDEGRKTGQTFCGREQEINNNYITVYSYDYIF